MPTKSSATDRALRFLAQKKHIRSRDLALNLRVSRQRAHAILAQLLREGRIVKLGSTAHASYAVPDYAATHLEIYPARFQKNYRASGLREDEVFEEAERRLPQLARLPRNIRQIFRYAFTEMLNNAIEHSASAEVRVDVSVERGRLDFSIEDHGIGAFRKVMAARHLGSELSAAQDILKGKITTSPEGHTGQGIFFTSKAADQFDLKSYGYKMLVDNKIDDVFLSEAKNPFHGTRVRFSLATDSERLVAEVFERYTNTEEGGELGFDRTEVRVKLYTREGTHVSRSQARRILVSLERFDSVVLDFDKVEAVGQAFADEIFRVFRRQFPKIKIIPTNMNEAVAFMVKRAQGENSPETLFS
ncbi:MAG TPA: DUF4325 domain-containing protein [Candidatus Paceibacterota bacterium]